MKDKFKHNPLSGGGKERMKEYTKEEIWDYLLECGYATEDELQLVTNINGWSVESMESVIYAKTGYRNLDQLKESGE